MKTRTLKVRMGSYDRELKRQGPYYIRPPVPFILLKGYWLEKLNFRIGTVVQLDLKESQIVLTIQPS